MAGNPGGERASPFSIQLVEAYVHEMKVARRALDKDESAEPTVRLGTPSAAMQEDMLGFSVRWTANVTFPLSPELVVDLSCTVTGEFISENAVSDELYDSFQNRESFILLWPYLRAYVGEIGRMVAVELPPLPTVDVRRFFAQQEDSGDAVRDTTEADEPSGAG